MVSKRMSESAIWIFSYTDCSLLLAGWREGASFWSSKSVHDARFKHFSWLLPMYLWHKCLILSLSLFLCLIHIYWGVTITATIATEHILASDTNGEIFCRTKHFLLLQHTNKYNQQNRATLSLFDTTRESLTNVERIRLHFCFGRKLIKAFFKWIEFDVVEALSTGAHCWTENRANLSEEEKNWLCASAQFLCKSRMYMLLRMMLSHFCAYP